MTRSGTRNHTGASALIRFTDLAGGGPGRREKLLALSSGERPPVSQRRKLLNPHNFLYLFKFVCLAANDDACSELMARGPDDTVELAEQLLQRTATWPWARRAFEATAPANCSEPSATPPAFAPAGAHPT